MSGPVIATVVAANYLPWVRVWRESLRRHAPDVPVQVLLCAPDAECQAVADTGLEIVPLSVLLSTVVEGMLRRYKCRYFTSAIKPFLIRHLLARGYSSLLYLDADILVTGSLEPLRAEAAGHAVSLTPHRLTPPPDGDRTLLLSGTYNAGFVGVADSPAAHGFLDWWASRLETHCRGDVEHGMNGDQRWLDLTPGMVHDLHLVRDPGCNVAYWNLDERPVTRAGAEWRVGEGPLRFFHFSGYSPARPEQVSRYAPDTQIEALGALAGLFRDYAEQLRAAGWTGRDNTVWPWGPPRGVWGRVRRLLGQS